MKNRRRGLRRTCLVDEALRLLLHPLLVVVFHVLFVLPAAAVSLPHGRLQNEKVLSAAEANFPNQELYKASHVQTGGLATFSSFSSSITYEHYPSYLYGYYLDQG